MNAAERKNRKTYPMAALRQAAIAYAVWSAESGTDPTAGLRALAELAGNRRKLNRVLLAHARFPRVGTGGM